MERHRGKIIVLTGSAGFIGRRVAWHLEGAGHRVVPFDRVTGQDLLNREAVHRSMAGVDALVHGALLDDAGANLTAVDHLIDAVLASPSCRTLVFLSSVDALGLFKGEGTPDAFPLDDDHPARPASPYGRHKLEAERRFLERLADGTRTVVCLRPPGVWDEATYGRIGALRAERPSYEYDPYWEYGAFLDVRDLAALVEAVITRGIPVTSGTYLCAAADLTTSGPDRYEWTRRLHPTVPWRSEADRALPGDTSLVDCHRARAAFSWEPRHRWSAGGR